MTDRVALYHSTLIGFTGSIFAMEESRIVKRYKACLKEYAPVIEEKMKDIRTYSGSDAYETIAIRSIALETLKRKVRNKCLQDAFNSEPPATCSHNSYPSAPNLSNHTMRTHSKGIMRNNR